MPLASDDNSHDEALASRIAALNMLDLDLEHLGVEVDDEAGLKGIHEVVASCGEGGLFLLSYTFNRIVLKSISSSPCQVAAYRPSVSKSKSRSSCSRSQSRRR